MTNRNEMCKIYDGVEIAIASDILSTIEAIGERPEDVTLQPLLANQIELYSNISGIRFLLCNPDKHMN